ncbi:heterokaryon incompatibility protein-domain-containing protein [Xylaria sp. FL1042]|nr:heterokaryon incompatibility protein-domain-containing protein [Xylaria sp. FL1042]
MTSEFAEEGDNSHVDPHLLFRALEKIRLAKKLPRIGNTALCKLCLDMSIKILEGNKYYHIDNLWNLPGLAANCSFCSLVEQCIRAPTAVTRAPLPFSGALGVAGIDEDEVVQLIIRPDENLLDLGFVRQGESKEELLTTSSIKLFTDSPAPITRRKTLVPPGMAVSLVPDLSNVGTLIATWLEECRLNHPDCNAPNPAVETSLPTRVLDIRDARLTGQVRLLCTDNVPGSYIALSHSWGGHQPTKSVKSNLAARCTGFPLSELPQTFRDAVAIAVEIRIRHIWIDSLSAIMENVYLHSYITIATTRAANSKAGFLGPRNFAHTVELAKVAPRADDPMTRSIYACQRRSFANDVDEGPLNRRAWVLQERHQVYWECWQYHQGEDLEYKYLGVMKKEAFPVQLSPKSLLCSSPTRSSEFPKEWWHLSSEYSSYGLTFQTDKLIAISGLVRKLETRLQITFMKGVWREFLHHSVLWSTRTEDLEYLPLVGVPSWSWASRKGPINFVQLYDYSPVSDFTIHETSRGSSGSLFVRGCLAKLSPHLRISDVRYGAPVTDETAFPPELDYFETIYRAIQIAKDSHSHGDVETGITMVSEDTPLI